MFIYYGLQSVNSQFFHFEHSQDDRLKKASLLDLFERQTHAVDFRAHIWRFTFATPILSARPKKDTPLYTWPLDG